MKYHLSIASNVTKTKCLNRRFTAVKKQRGSVDRDCDPSGVISICACGAAAVDDGRKNENFQNQKEIIIKNVHIFFFHFKKKPF